MLVLGSSLQVYSAFRFIRFASQNNIPVTIVNVGETRADNESCLKLKVEQPVGDLLGGVIKNLE